MLPLFLECFVAVPLSVILCIKHMTHFALLQAAETQSDNETFECKLHAAIAREMILGQRLQAMETYKESQQERVDGLEGSLECCRQSLSALENQLRESVHQVWELEAALVECEDLSKAFHEERASLTMRIEEAEKQVFVFVYIHGNNSPFKSFFLLQISRPMLMNESSLNCIACLPLVGNVKFFL
jgi:septal ring factor EnvC (AmiA/AmiB activator)